MAEQYEEFILMGHPAWPDPIRTRSEEDARQWFAEHRDSGHPIKVDRREVVRRPFLTSEAACTQDHRRIGPSRCPGCGYDPLVRKDG